MSLRPAPPSALPAGPMKAWRRLPPRPRPAPEPSRSGSGFVDLFGWMMRVHSGLPAERRQTDGLSLSGGLFEFQRTPRARTGKGGFAVDFLRSHSRNIFVSAISLVAASIDS